MEPPGMILPCGLLACDGRLGHHHQRTRTERQSVGVPGRVLKIGGCLAPSDRSPSEDRCPRQLLISVGHRVAVGRFHPEVAGSGCSVGRRRDSVAGLGRNRMHAAPNIERHPG